MLFFKASSLLSLLKEYDYVIRLISGDRDYFRLILF